MVMEYTRYKITGTIAAGATTVTASSKPIRGRIVSVEIIYPVHTCTLDLDVNTGTGLQTQKILDLAASNTDTVKYPETPLHDYTGAAINLSDASGGNTAKYGPFMVFGTILMSIAAGTAGETITVYVNAEEY